jgi:hypothetical protein
LFVSFFKWLRFLGSVEVTNDPNQRKTFSEVLLGWQSDAEVSAALSLRNGDVDYFESGLAVLNDLQSFQSIDDYGNYLQTSTRRGTVTNEGTTYTFMFSHNSQ